MNRNVIIRYGKELASEDEASSSHIRFSPRVDDQACEPSLHTDPMDEAITCWDIGKAIFQIHDGSQLMTSTLHGFIENDLKEWISRKKQ
jgi:hypothetical protein